MRWFRKLYYNRLLRLYLIRLTILSIVAAGVVWILNIVLHGSWSDPLAAIFVILSVLFAFFQWMLPRTTDGTVYDILFYEIRNGLAPKRGAIIIRTGYQLLG